MKYVGNGYGTAGKKETFSKFSVHWSMMLKVYPGLDNHCAQRYAHYLEGRVEWGRSISKQEQCYLNSRRRFSRYRCKNDGRRSWHRMIIIAHFRFEHSIDSSPLAAGLSPASTATHPTTSAFYVTAKAHGIETIDLSGGQTLRSPKTVYWRHA